MDSRAEISSFLNSRRARLSPEEAGVPLYSGSRRVPGLRREEVAHLAGVSSDYYARLERGKISGASREVLEAVARALKLDDDERDHLFNLVQITQRRSPRKKSSNRTIVRPGIQSVLDSIDTPALVQNARLDRLAFNRIGRALHSLPADGSHDQYNYAQWLFLDSRAKRFHRDYADAAHNVVALLHAATAQDPYDKELIEVIGTLSTQSDQFRTMWASHDVFRYRAGAKLLTHAEVGDLEFGYESFELSTDPGLVMLVYTVEPDSPTADAMKLLASWTAPAFTEAKDVSAEA
ncbi:Transcriptional regulator, contains XRE-family HTH domain [Brevibacterium sandarakinum]|uniref:Transcriptional regulator, contains XRE-family HTH domain n=1 Tax=Brevibacterium sandarakinum TaxID=629680 RepID=A0A1H1X509_BRESA|nr:MULTISPECIES: helix-turn-helix transcriptional regulator [Micrococcales]SDT04151.1 Transcriptional regulator, contains XRE-family HTH domain [Brevibacterium sandarakinum]